MKIFWWIKRLPRRASSISVEWPIKEGGICAYGFTDDKGKAYLGVSSLNTIGKVTGLPLWICGRRFRSDMVVGFAGHRPLVMNISVTATSSGLELVIRMPPHIKSARDYSERRFTPWGSEAPKFSFMISPTFEPLATRGFSELTI